MQNLHGHSQGGSTKCNSQVQCTHVEDKCTPLLHCHDKESCRSVMVHSLSFYMEYHATYQYSITLHALQIKVRPVYTSFREIYTSSTPLIHFHVKGTCRSIMVHSLSFLHRILRKLLVFHYTTNASKAVYTSFREVYTSSTCKKYVLHVYAPLCDDILYYNLNSTKNIPF